MVKNPGITDQDVEVAKLFERRFGHRLDLGKTTDIRTDPQSATSECFHFFDHGRNLFLIPPIDHHIGPFTSEQQGGRSADTRTRPSDQRGSAIETHGVSSFSPFSPFPFSPFLWLA